MASSNRLVVEVVGDTSKLSASLNKAQADINRFAGKSKIKSTAADPLLADIRRMKAETEDLAKRAREVETRSNALNSSFARTGTAALVAGVAINTFGRNLQELGGNAAKFGQALNDISTGNIVGFVKALQSVDDANPSKVGADLLKFGSAAKATEAATKFAAIGLDKFAASAREAAKAIGELEMAARKPISFAAVQGTFGVSPLDPLLGKDADKKKRQGITQEQLNTFFDNDIARLLDRSQDGSLPNQVAKLREIEQILKERQAAQKDVTRRLKLGDEIVAVQRQRRGIEAQIADDAKRRAEDAKRAAEELRKEREAREKALEEARRVALQAKQFRALGFAADGSDVVPGADNLRKQLASLTERIAGSSVKLSSKLENQLEGVRKVLSGKFGQVTRESRERIQELFATIRGEFDKQGKGPLTKTSGLDTKKILAGLGLSPADEAELRSRLSNVNSAGRVNTGGTSSRTPTQVVESHVTVLLDGDVVGRAVTRSQQKAKKRNPAQRRGPNRGK